MQRIYNHAIIALHLCNRQPKKLGIIPTKTKAIHLYNQKTIAFPSCLKYLFQYRRSHITDLGKIPRHNDN